MSTALLIIDTQVGLIEPAYQSEEILDHIKTLLTQARASHTPVIYIQHDGPKGHGLEVGTSAWNIHPAIAPQEGEPIVHKRASDSFYDTSLQQELEARGIKHLVVVGGQTEYCVDTTIRRATTMGYNVTLVGDAHTTDDYDEAILTAAQRIAYLNDVVNGFRTDDHTITVKPTSEVTFMPEHISKTKLLDDMQKGYNDFENLLSSFNEQQMTTPGNNGEWSIKDHIAHITSWQQRTLNILHAVRENGELPDPTPDMNMDEVNEMFYQQNKSLPLDKVLADFRSTYQQLLDRVQAMSEEDLNRPISWLDNNSGSDYVPGNTYEHYQEHTQYIQPTASGVPWLPDMGSNDALV